MTRISQLRTGAIAVLLAAGSLTCGENVAPTTATDIEPFGGDGQTGAAGSALATPLTVAVTDGSGNAVPGVSVSWTAQGGGSVSSATSKTGSDGHASVTRVLGPQLGQQTTIASVSGLQGSPVTFVATATQGGPIAIATNPPTSALTLEVWDPIAQPVIVVTDGSGTPSAGVVVTASLATGTGTLRGTPTATTDASGVARFGDLGIEGLGEHTLQFAAGSTPVISSPVNVLPLSTKATTGEWGPIVPWDIVPLHMTLLPTGKILAWGKTDVADTMGMPRLWDRTSGASPAGARMVDVDTMLFCSGHTIMPDGRVMVSGGHLKDDRGLDVTNIFDPVSESWIRGLPKMAHGRWYPTVTTLPDGRMLTMAGRDATGEQVTIPEIWEGGRWVELLGAGTYVTPYYPRNFVDPKNGLIFYAGERIQSRWFNVDGSAPGGRGSWTPGPSHIYRSNRDYGSAVMYESGKILYVGGGGMKNWGGGTWPDAKSEIPTETAETIDLTSPNPTWQGTASMAFKRRHMNATVLPDGQVLATGGTSGGGISILTNIDPGLAVHEAEIWNPATGRWTTLAANDRNHMRLYHSVALLLPDATVLSGSSGDAKTIGPSGGEIDVPPERNHEIFSPPYMFKGARPTITSVSPATVSYGGTITISTPNAAQVTTVRWIKLGSVTHAFDASAVASTLGFEVADGSVSVTTPLLSRQATPGYYMIFILNRNGVPSDGKIIKIQ